jgi:predicted Rossmann-fold nucleotide-binding protein
VGTDYWRGLFDWIRATPMAFGAVDPDDLDLLAMTDDPAEVVRIITEDALTRSDPQDESLS